MKKLIEIDLYLKCLICLINILLYRADSLQIIKAFRIFDWVFSVAIQNPYDPSLCNIIFTNNQFLYSLLINENDIESIKKNTFKLDINFKTGNCYGLSITKHLNDRFVISMTSQMFYYENNAFGIDTIFVIVDFYLNTSSCSKISKDYGISILRYTNVEHYLNQSDPYYNMSAPPNMFYTTSLSLYEKNADPGEYIFNDVTEHLWPRYVWYGTDSWHFNLPKFNLNNTIKIHVGNNINTENYELTPFIHWQNSLFVFTAIEANTSNTPDFITIDLNSKTIKLNLKTILSVQTTYNMVFNAQVVPFPSPDHSDFPHNYITADYQWLFEFTNTPWTYLSSNATYYLVLDKITVFALKFLDLEEDFIKIRVVENNDINSYAQLSVNDSSIISLYLQPNIISNKAVQLKLQYTDKYHDDTNFNKNITFDLYLFAVDPPYFSQELQSLSITKWTDYSLNLPPVVDVNNLEWSAALIDPPLWISLQSNDFIYFSASNASYNIPETTLVIVRITNKMDAWSEYNFTVIVQPILTPIFGKINDASFNKNNMNIVKINYKGSSTVTPIDCSNGTQIYWINFNSTSNELIINAKYLNLVNQWVMLKSYDSWSNPIYSNNFTLTFIDSIPLYIGNEFGPLTIFKGEKALFLIPHDLFVSSDPKSLQIWVYIFNWSVNSNLTAYAFYSIQQENYYLYLISNTINLWDLWLSATDSFEQVVEVSLKLNVISWASKDWLKCKNNLQSGWTEWVENYVLDSSGVWLWSSTYFKPLSIEFFNICGFIVLLNLVINLIMILKFEISVLQSLEFAQTLLIFILFADTNQGMIQFWSWFQISKLDLSFLNIAKINKLLGWEFNQKLNKVQFYCQTTILNYLYLIVIVVILFVLFKLIKLLSKISSILQLFWSKIEAKVNRKRIVWIFLRLYLPFVLINIIYEASTLGDHLLL